MKLFVTGGAGYIGSHFCKLAAGQGHQITVFDSLERGHAHAAKWGVLIKGDLRAPEQIWHALEVAKPDVVVHFAAFALVGESVQNPALYQQNNVEGSRNLLQAMQASGCREIVFSSTCAVYGVPEVVEPLSENLPMLPINPYGQTKADMEALLEAETGNGLRSICLRYFNAAGADPEGEIGEEHEPETHAIPLMLRAMHTGQPFQIFGGDYPTPDGTAIRDYVHVNDIAMAHLSAIKRLPHIHGKKAYNLGTGKGTSVRALLQMVENVTGQKVPHIIAARRPGDPPMLVANPALANAELGWVPASSLEEIIRSAWRFFSR